MTEFILEGLRSGGIPRNNVEFEITESAYMNNFSIANAFLAELKKRRLQDILRRLWNGLLIIKLHHRV